MTKTELIQTANGYLLCSKHAEGWQRGGNDVSMWAASESEAEEGGNVCADCLDEEQFETCGCPKGEPHACID